MNARGSLGSPATYRRHYLRRARHRAPLPIEEAYLPSRHRGSSGICLSPQSQLFDNIIGAGEDRLRDGEPECLRSLEIDDQLEPGRLDHHPAVLAGRDPDLLGLALGVPAGRPRGTTVGKRAPSRYPARRCGRTKNTRLREGRISDQLEERSATPSTR